MWECVFKLLDVRFQSDDIQMRLVSTCTNASCRLGPASDIIPIEYVVILMRLHGNTISRVTTLILQLRVQLEDLCDIMMQ